MTHVGCQIIEFYRFYKLVLLQPINPLNQTFLLSALSFAFPHLASRNSWRATRYLNRVTRTSHPTTLTSQAEPRIPPTALYYFNRISR